MAKALGWGPAELLKEWQLHRATEQASLRLKGYVGWLLTAPAFLTEADQLAGRWGSLPNEHRPPFPLSRYYATTSSEEASRFLADLRTFLDRWGLTELASWELP
jgi:hypothetical protein